MVNFQFLVQLLSFSSICADQLTNTVSVVVLFLIYQLQDLHFEIFIKWICILTQVKGDSTKMSEVEHAKKA